MSKDLQVSSIKNKKVLSEVKEEDLLSKVKVTKDDSYIEKKILVASITNVDFLTEIYNVLRPEELQNRYAQILLGIVFGFFEKYGKAPELEINEVIALIEDDINTEDLELIYSTLEIVSDFYETEEDIKVGRFLETVYEYIKKRRLSLKTEKVLKLLNSGDLDKAELELASPIISGEIARSHHLAEANPFHVENIKKFFFRKKEETVFRFKTEEGRKVFGYLKRGWLVSLMGAEKAGKSHKLYELALRMAREGIKVAFFPIEMSEDQSKGRIYQRITNKVESLETLTSNPIQVPVRDCELNQIGGCTKRERKSKVNILDHAGKIIQKNLKDYKPCSACLKTNFFDFVPSAFLYPIEVKEMTIDDVMKASTEYMKLYGDNLRIKSFGGSFKGSINDIFDYTEKLKKVEGFDADVLIIDYLDITDKEIFKGLSDRDKIDELWRRTKSYAVETNRLIITVEQGKRELQEMKIPGPNQVSDDKRKNAHIDAKFAISKTKKEHSLNMQRINCVLHRHRRFDPRLQIVLYECNEVSNPALFSCLTYINEEDEKYPKKN